MDQQRAFYSAIRPSLATSSTLSSSTCGSYPAIAGSVSSNASTFSSTSSRSHPLYAAQPVQAIAGTASLRSPIEGQLPEHRLLYIRLGTFRICRAYTDDGKCKNSQCQFLHVCRSWLAGYASCKNRVSR